LASKKVGKRGKVIGLDMTHEMIQRAKENARRMNLTNVEFKEGEMERRIRDEIERRVRALAETEQSKTS
jgi:tRNA/tmRNA/rRNA uracil-C5-methylase (TrmA/RlmC/RlmD family)